MKIVALNGSPNGKNSSTNIMINAILRGAKKEGAEILNIFLSEKNIEYCRGCHNCWFKTPGICIIKDDMAEILSLLRGAEIIILASPLYFLNISGTLKVFIDRLTATGGDPHFFSNDEIHTNHNEIIIPKFLMISNCGFSDKSEFDIVSLWINRIAGIMKTKVIGEIYAIEGRQFKKPDNSKILSNYIELLEKEGRNLANKKISSENIKKILDWDTLYS